MINLFQKTEYGIDNWINEGSDWVIESIGAQYISVSIYSPLSASSSIKLSLKLRLTERNVWLILKTMTKNALHGVISHI